MRVKLPLFVIGGLGLAKADIADFVEHDIFASLFNVLIAFSYILYTLILNIVETASKVYPKIKTFTTQKGRINFY